MKSILFSLLSGVALSASHTHSHTYVATFDSSNNGIGGTVTVDTQMVTIDLTLTDAKTTELATCIDGGLKWHIHTVWEYADNSDRYGGTECGAAYTSGHTDTWNACGPATAGAWCATSSAGNESCIPTDTYSPDFVNDPFSAEIGDWSSKYEALVADGSSFTGSFSNFYEVVPSDVAGMSVVFHCNDGSRIFCAPFVEGTEEASETSVDQDSTKVAEADFSVVLTSDSTVRLYPCGAVDIYLDAKDVFDEATFGCTEFEYSVFEVADTAAATALAAGAMLGTDCDSKVGDQYDPTKQCLPWVEDDYCSGGILCGDAAYSYSCDGVEDRYSCAPGDLSGKFGTWSDPGSVVLAVDTRDDDDAYMSLIPKTDDLIGKVLAVTCAKSATITSPTFLACALFEEGEADEEDGVSQLSGLVACVVMVLNFLFA